MTGEGTIEVINLNAANITVGTINGQQIAPGAVDVDNIADYAVTTEKIALGAVTAKSMAAGCITGTHISAGAVSAGKLAIGGDLTNFITVNEMLPESAVPSISYAGNRGSAIADGYIIKPQSTDDGILLSEMKTNCFAEGDRLHYKMTVKADTASSVRVIIFFYDNYIYRTAAISEYHTAGTTDTTIEGDLTVPALTSVDRCVVGIRDYTMEGQLYVKNASCRRQTGTTYIADGAITTDKIVASAITGDKIAAHTITANNILAGTITAASGIIADINADTITTGTLKGITIQSTNYTEAVGTLNPLSGSQLNLADGSFKSRNLRWDSDGNVTCSNIKAESGTFAGKVTATSGAIGGWEIDTEGYLKNEVTVGTSTAGTIYSVYLYPIIADSGGDTKVICAYQKPTSGSGSSAVGFYITANGLAYFNDNLWCRGDGIFTGIVSGQYFNSTSDRRLKKDLLTLDNRYVEVLNEFNPVAYRFIKGDEHIHLGFIAQEVEQIFRKHNIMDVPVVSKGDDGIYALDYSQITALCVLGYKSHERRIAKLENELAVAKVLIQNLMLKETD